MQTHRSISYHFQRPEEDSKSPPRLKMMFVEGDETDGQWENNVVCMNSEQKDNKDMFVVQSVCRWITNLFVK